MNAKIVFLHPPVKRAGPFKLIRDLLVSRPDRQLVDIGIVLEHGGARRATDDLQISVFGLQRRKDRGRDDIVAPAAHPRDARREEQLIQAA